MLDDHSTDRQKNFPSKFIWKSGAPPRISSFAWEAAKERILTLDNLMKCGITTVNKVISAKIVWNPVIICYSDALLHDSFGP